MAQKTLYQTIQSTTGRYQTLLYIFIAGIALCMAYFEFRERKRCTYVYSFSKCQVDPEKSTMFSNPGDSPSVLLNKMKLLANHESTSVKWRISLLLSIVTSFFLWGLLITPGSLPVFTDFMLSVILIYTVVYFFFFTSHVILIC